MPYDNFELKYRLVEDLLTFLVSERKGEKREKVRERNGVGKKVIYVFHKENGFSKWFRGVLWAGFYFLLPPASGEKFIPPHGFWE